MSTRDINEPDLGYADIMERALNGEEKRQRERLLMEEGTTLWRAKKQEEYEQELRDQYELRELSRTKLFGKPGHGAPTENIKKKKFTEYQLEASKEMHNYNPYGDTEYNYGPREGATPVARPPPDYRTTAEPPRPQTYDSYEQVRPTPNGRDHSQDVLTFGRPGYGAPVRTNSGHLRTSVVGNPEIRFQDDKSVQKTVTNNLRYSANREDKAHYQQALEEQIKQRKSFEKAEKQREIEITRQLNQYEGLQWGRPGPGGVYWRESAVTGQKFFDKMGWSSSADPRKRDPSVLHMEAEGIKKEINEHDERKKLEHLDIKSDVGLELVPLMKQSQGGKPRKDPSTGYMLSHSLSTTDVTKAQVPGNVHREAVNSYLGRRERHESNDGGGRRRYLDVLLDQVQNKLSNDIERRKLDDERMVNHFQSFDTYWGRPGHGAIKESGVQKENLMKILHYPSQKGPDNVELITLERLPVK